MTSAEETTRFAPDHLEPINPFDRTGYDLAVYESLVDRDKALVWMISRPSFDIETAVAIEANPVFAAEPESTTATIPDPFGDGGGRRSEIIGYDYFVTATKPKRQIWRSEEISQNRVGSAFSTTNEIEKKRVGIPKSVVEVITEAWEEVLGDTRYVTENYRGLDGITFQFGTRGKAGEIWCPDGGPPLQLAELGELLLRVVEAEEVEREVILREGVDLAKLIAGLTVSSEKGRNNQPTTAPEPISEGRSQ